MPPKTHLTAEQRREKTVAAVVDLCANEDPASITTTEIAKRMKVTQGALFRHFVSKDAIWESVIGWVAKQIMKRLERAKNDAATPLQALKAMFFAHIEFISERPGIPRLLLGQLQHSRSTPARLMVRQLLSEYRKSVEKQLADAQSDGEVRKDLNIEIAATQYIGMIQGLVIQSLLTGDMQYIVDQAPGAFEVFCHGICAPSE